MALPVERVRFAPRPDAAPDMQRWPYTLPAVRSVVADGLTLGPLTVLVGENGSGKSTLVEALAARYGMSPEGGSTGARHSTRASESLLGGYLELARGTGASRWGFYLRAETMHGYFTYLEQNPASPRSREPRFHEMSHGESFVEVLATRFEDSGLYLLDEPESALSFTSSLTLVAVLTQLVATGNAQVVVATHSPLVAAVPGARILEVGEWGLREARWHELDLVQNWRGFLADPQVYFRHLL